MVTRQPDGRQQLAALAGINPLYIGFGAVLGTVQGGLPPVLRDQGYEISAIGLVYALYLPFGLAFLWAHLVDRWQPPFAGRRSGWIWAMQGLAVPALVLVAFGQGWPPALLIALGLLVTLAMATMDTALDALAVERVAPARRPLAAALKLAALALGAILGNGLFVLLFAAQGWRVAFLSLAALVAVLTLPLLLLREGRSPPSAAARRASLFQVLADPARREKLLLLTAISCVIFPLAGLNRVMLVDIGVPLERIGQLVGTLGPLSMLAVSVLAVPLMARAGLARSFALFGGLTALATGLLMLGHGRADHLLALSGTVLIGAGVSGVFVTLVARILGWAAGNQPATDYAAFYGISRFASTVLTMLAAPVIGWTGWTGFYLTGLAALVLVLALARTRIFRSET